ncbi:DUF1588 domain-containing protein [bacterium]|nr:DUF1588 domain-containing protein [bacterium]
MINYNGFSQLTTRRHHILTRPLLSWLLWFAVAGLCDDFKVFARDGGTNSVTVNSNASGQRWYESGVADLLREHCIDCHNPDDPAGEIDLVSLVDPLNVNPDLSRWESVLTQLVLGEMPPLGESQPTEVEKGEVVKRIHMELDKSGRRFDLFEKLDSPEFGNLVNHQKLFSGDVLDKPYSPARLWRTSPKVFENTKNRYGFDAQALRQPFIVDDKEGIKDYANLLFADSAVVDVLLMNAGDAADKLIERRSELKAIAEVEKGPNDEPLRIALSEHFVRVVYRDPLPSEMDRYVDLFRRTSIEAGSLESLRLTLMAIMLHHESVYRIEIGLGQIEDDGRRMLSPVELSFAIAYALTDQRPDAALLTAAGSNQLDDRKDVRKQVERLLADKAIDKPRILRFFQEFFGYSHAHKVFKDEKRSGGFSYYGENYPEMYERDADFFVLNLLEQDRDVFRQLLTSNKYFLLNRQTFRNTVYDFYLRNQQELDQDIFPESKQRELLDLVGLDDWGQLNKKYHLHKFNRGFNGSVRAIKQIVKEVRDWKNTTDEDKLLHGMQPLYQKYPMVYDLADDEQDFLLPQPYARPNRAGMLTHPAWLIAHSLNDTTDPIRRGKWIQERLLAGLVPDVPITVDATIPEDHTKTLRERLSGTEKQECWRCHRKMNPLGYPFESYDDFGRFRSRELLDKLPKVDGAFPSKSIDSTGMLVGTGDELLDGEINGALELIQQLAKSERVRQSMIRHVFRYFMGRNERLTDSATLIEADRVYVESGGSFNELLVSLLTSDSFLYRK